MVKKLDILILKAFIGPFIATFIVSEFILVLQFYWVYLDDFVGKGLNFGTVLYVTWLVSIVMFQMALPLALLLSSIMTFGNLGETFEIVAIKSAGISLARFMRPLLVTTFGLCCIAFLFANNIIPFATLKLNTLKHDIIVTKPALDIKEGSFYKEIPGYVIKIAQKEKNDSVIHGVIIYEKNETGLQDNVLTAETGIMRVSDDKQYLEFTLKDGVRYSERGNRGTINTEFTRMGFREYKKLFDLSAFMMASRKEDSSIRYDPALLSVRQLGSSIDSIKKKRDTSYTRWSKSSLGPWFAFERFADSNWRKMAKDTFKVAAKDTLIPKDNRLGVYNGALAQLEAARPGIDAIFSDYNIKQESYVKHSTEWHKKFALAFACFVLFMIGAPLGAIIRKGGLGLPLVFALIFFAVFHLLNTFGTKFAKEEVMTPFAGIWLASMLLTPIGIFLTYKAMRDSQLFNKDYYLKLVKNIRMFFAKFAKRQKAS